MLVKVILWMAFIYGIFQNIICTHFRIDVVDKIQVASYQLLALKTMR